MKKGVFLCLSLTLVLVVLVAACNQPANVDHSKMDHNSMNHNSMNQNSSMPMNSNMPMNHADGMNHSEMKSDPNAASAPYDLQFIDTMSVHHQDAVTMAQMALEKSSNDELKKFAQKIIDDQKKENEQMKEWRDKWFAGKPAAKNMELPGMMDSMKPMDGDHLKKMNAMDGREFDLHFLDMMIPHHQGAVLMAKDALQKSEKSEIKTLAQTIISAQETEIKQMTDWKAKWSK